MNCPECDSEEIRVLETRKVAGEIYRRRGCMSCRTDWATQEVVLKKVPRSLFTGIGVTDGVLRNKTRRKAEAKRADAVDYMAAWRKK